jgi:hypothetical protein
MANWFAAHDTFLNDLPSLRSVHVVRYESLVRDPAAELGTVADFLGLDGSLDATAWQSGRSEAYAARWAGLATDRLPWRRALRRSLVAEFGERTAAYGYDIEDLDVLRPWEPVHHS